MSRFHLKPRTLLLLALFQLVAGPLVLLQVTVFCSLTVRETPREGVAVAMVKAWKSETFQSLLTAAQNGRAQADNGSVPASDDKAGHAKAKLHLLPWHSLEVVSLPCVMSGDRHVLGKAWTPAWPQAPPGTPPRVG